MDFRNSETYQIGKADGCSRGSRVATVVALFQRRILGKGMIDSTLPNYFVFQRCRHYGLWPELEYRGTAPFKMDCFKGSELADVNFRVWYRAYSNLPNLNEAPTELFGDVIQYIEFGQGIGFCIGDSRFSEGKSGDLVGQTSLVGPKQGEVDLLVSCESENGYELDLNNMVARIAPVMPAVVLYFSSLIGDIVVPASKPMGVHRSGANLTFAGSAIGNIKLLQRQMFQGSVLGHALYRCGDFAGKISREDVLEVGTAAKRIFSGMQEFDPIDKYCDYWEACEFLAKAKKFKPDHRLAKMLGDATGFNQSTLKNKIVGPLYNLRKDIVHNAIEDIDRIKRAIPIIEDVAVLVFNHRCGLRRSPVLGALADYYTGLQKHDNVPI